MCVCVCVCVCGWWVGVFQVNERLAQENKLLRTGMARLEDLMASNEQRVRNHTLEDIDRLLQDREVATLALTLTLTLALTLTQVATLLSPSLSLPPSLSSDSTRCASDVRESAERWHGDGREV